MQDQRTLPNQDRSVSAWDRDAAELTDADAGATWRMVLGCVELGHRAYCRASEDADGSVALTFTVLLAVLPLLAMVAWFTAVALGTLVIV